MCVLFSVNSSILYHLTEHEIHSRRLPDGIGTRWKDLARELGFNRAFITATENDKDCNKECCIALLVKWIEREGEQGATCEKLATALTNIGLQTLADELSGMCCFRLCAKPNPEQKQSKHNTKDKLWYNHHPLTYQPKELGNMKYIFSDETEMKKPSQMNGNSEN